VKSIPLERLNGAIETTLPGETPILTYGSLTEDHWQKILQRCKKHFHQSELKLIEKFIRENRQPDEVLGLRIKKMIFVSAAEDKSVP